MTLYNIRGARKMHDALLTCQDQASDIDKVFTVNDCFKILSIMPTY